MEHIERPDVSEWCHTIKAGEYKETTTQDDNVRPPQCRPGEERGVKDGR